jgi:predicted Rdx family selenoprotein
MEFESSIRESEQPRPPAYLSVFIILMPIFTIPPLTAQQYAQELLQTFSTAIGEIALIPVTDGVFTITMTHAAASSATAADDTGLNVVNTSIWDRKTDGGFPETKELKNRVRNIIEPDRDLGHIDRSLKKGKSQPGPLEEPSKAESGAFTETKTEPNGAKDCEDCK